jgi:hypothetical protein
MMNNPIGRECGFYPEVSNFETPRSANKTVSFSSILVEFVLKYLISVGFALPFL